MFGEDDEETLPMFEVKPGGKDDKEKASCCLFAVSHPACKEQVKGLKKTVRGKQEG